MPWDAVDHNGQWVEVDDDVAHIIQQVGEHFPELSVRYCENPGLGEAPYMVIERLPNGLEMPVMTCWQLDNRLLEVLHQADMSKHDVQKIMDQKNARARMLIQDKQQYWRDYVRDVIVTAANHSGSSFTFKDPREGHEGEIVKIEDDPSRRTRIKP